MLIHNVIIKVIWLSSTNRNVIFGPMLNSPVCLDLLVEKIFMGTVYLFIVTNKYPCNLWVQIIKRLQQGSIMLVMFECFLCLLLQLLLLSLQNKSLDDQGLKVWEKRVWKVRKEVLHSDKLMPIRSRAAGT